MEYVIAIILLFILGTLHEVLSELRLAKKDREDERSRRPTP